MNSLIALAFVLGAPLADGLRAPAGFEIIEFSNNALASDITCMTVDPKGRIVVAGRGYIRVLVDENNDGIADRAIDVTANVKDAAHGLLWEKDVLYAVVDGGLQRFAIDASGDKAVAPPALIRPLKTGGEHDAHALARGRDGWLYLLCGNSAKIDRSFATASTTPIQEPVAGCIVRFSPDFKQSEIVADGFRNPYGFAFNANNDLFTFDADNERCVSLPWYEGMRFYHVVPGGHYGWRSPQFSETWRCPPYFADVVPPVADLGRGSPTGVACCLGARWPKRYHGGFFLLDWTFGRIDFVGVHKVNGAYVAERPERFVEAIGVNGFAPTAAVFHGDSLYVAIGGRGTRGAIYRIRFRSEDEQSVAQENAPARDLSWQARFQAELPAEAGQRGHNALIDLYRQRAHFSSEILSNVVRANWDVPARLHCLATAKLISVLGKSERQSLLEAARTPQQILAVGWGVVEQEPALARELALRAFAQGTSEQRLHAVRLMQLACGDLTGPEAKATVWAGYTPRQALPLQRHPELRAALRNALPAVEPNLDRELTRTLGILQDDDPKTLQAIVMRLTPTSDPLDDVHHLIVLSRLSGSRTLEQTQATATALLALDQKIVERRRNRDRNWPLRIAELHAELARKDPRLNNALLHAPAFGRPDHVLFTRCPGFARGEAAAIFVRRSERDPTFAWNGELVTLLSELPAVKYRPLLRRLWDRGGLEDAILPLLARSAEPGDAARLLVGVTSSRLATVRACLDALDRLPIEKDGAAMFALVRGLRLLPETREGDVVRQQFVRMLRKLSGQSLGTDVQKWADWLAAARPDLAARLSGPDGVDIDAWRKRAARIDWSNGDVNRGRTVFAKASCAACHSGTQALGPDLNGVGARFSRADLFTAIVQPSKDISPRYRTTQIEATNGKTFQGLIVYEAVDGLILQTGPAETVRIAGDQIESTRLTDVSLMPAGLLDKLNDGEIADLGAYLLALGRK